MALLNEQETIILPPQVYHGECEHLRQTVGIEETLNPIRASVDIVRAVILIFKCYAEIFTNLTSSRHDDNFSAAGVSGDFRLFADKILLKNLRIFFVDYFDTATVFIAIAFAIVWTIARYFLVNCVFRPGARWSGVLEKNVEKLCESAWKTVAYFIMWIYSVYVVFFSGHTFFYESMQQFSDWTMRRPPGYDLELVYGLEFGFYFHSIYATFYMDAWRKDSIVMLVHHFVTITLVVFSYAIRCLKIGVLIFCLNDISDILLEGGKSATYMRHRKSGFSKFFNLISDITAPLFALTWAINRLWFHLVKVWRAGSLGIWASHPFLPLPFHLFINVFLGVLYLFYLYWFYFIAIFVIRVIFGKTGTAEDPREDEDATTKSNTSRNAAKKQAKTE